MRFRLLPVGFLCLFLCVRLAASPTIFVDGSRSDIGAQDGASWSTAYKELSAALAVASGRARSASAPVEIWVRHGVYRPSTNGLADPRTATFQIPSYTSVLGGFAGTETNPNQRTFPFNGPATVLSGDNGTPVAGGLPTTYSALLNWRPLLPDPAANQPGDPGFADNLYTVVTAREFGSVLDHVVIIAGNANYFHADDLNSSDVNMMMLPAEPVVGEPVRPARVLDPRVAGGGVFAFRDPLTASNEEAEYAARQEFTLRLSFCAVVGNFARIGGGLAAAHISVSVVDTQFHGNTADFDGGGFFGLDVAAGVQGGAFHDNDAMLAGAGASIVGFATKRSLYPSLSRTEYTKALKLHGLTLLQAQSEGNMQLQLTRYMRQMTKQSDRAAKRKDDLGAKLVKGYTAFEKVNNKLFGPAETNQATDTGAVARRTAKTGYTILKLAVAATDFGLQIAEAVDPSVADDPVFRGFQTFTENFTTYATPEGLATLAALEAVKAVEDAQGGPLRHRGLGAQLRRTTFERFFPKSEPVVFLGTSFTNNHADLGGGLSVIYANSRIERTRFDGNVADISGPGARVAGFGAHLVFNSVFTHNAGAADGSIYVERDSLFIAAHTTIAHNTSTYGSAVDIGESSQAKLLNCLLWNNRGANNATGADVHVLTLEELRSELGANFSPPPEALRFTSVGRLEIANSVVQSLASLTEGDDYLVPTVKPENPSLEELNGLERAFAEAEAKSMHEYFFIYNVGEGIRPGTKTKFGNTAADPVIGTEVRPTWGASAFYLGNPDRVNNASLQPLVALDFEGVALLTASRLTAAGALQTPAPQSRFYVAPVGAGTQDGTSWANASANLKTAMATEKAEVWVKQGTYYPSSTGTRDDAFVLANLARVYGGFAGHETELSQRNPAANPTIISGQLSDISPGAQNSHNLFRLANLNSRTVLDGFTLTGGRANGAGFTRDEGAAIHATNASPTIRNCVFIDNAANENGGAIMSVSSSGSNREGPVLEQCRFINNRSGRSGGAVYYASHARIDGCVFAQNTAQRNGGAATLLGPGLNGTAYVSNSLFHSNTVNGSGSFVPNGGAIYSSVRLELVNCIIADNTVQRSTARPEGGAGVASFSDTFLTNSVLWGNRLTGTASTASQERRQIDFDVPNTKLSPRHSIIEGLDAYAAGATDTFDRDPAFVAPSSGNYTPAAWSPLLNAGVTFTSRDYASADVAGNPRTFGAATDIGAYELQTPPDPRAGTIAVTRDCGATAGFTLRFDPPGGATVATPGWLVNRNDGAGFVLLAADAVHSGVNLLQLTLTNTNAEMSGWSYRFLSADGYRGEYKLPPIGRSRLYVKTGASGAGDGSSWLNAFGNIQLALAAATALPDPCVQIWVAAGTYQPGHTPSSTWQLRTGIALLGGFAGHETLLTQRDPLANPTILSGEIGSSSTASDNILHLFTNTGLVQNGAANRSAQLDGFFLRDTAGAAIRNNSGASPTLRRLIFESNRAGLANFAGSSPLVEDCVFRGNTVHDGAVTDVDSFSVLRRCIFANNLGNLVGGVRSTRSQTLIDHCVFWNNSGSSLSPGGVWADTGSVVTITGSIFWNNHFRNAPAELQYTEPAQLKATGGTFAVSTTIIQGLSGFTGSGNLAFDPLFVEPWSGNFALRPHSPAIAAGVGAIPFTGTAAASTVRLLATPLSVVTCGLGGVTLFTVNWAPGQSFTPVWEIEVGNAFVPVAGSGFAHSFVNGTNTQTLQLTLSPGPSQRVRVRDSLSGYVHAPTVVQLSLPTILRVRASASATGADGLTWNTAFPTLEAAHLASDDCTEIWVAAGTYTLPTEGIAFTRKVVLYGGFSGSEDLREQRGNAVTEIRGRVSIHNATSGSTLDRLTFTGGAVPGFQAVLISQSNVVFNDCVFTDAGGTGAYVHSGDALFTGCTFQNSADSGAVVASGAATFERCAFLNNRTAFSGGGLEIARGPASPPSVRLDRCRFVGNVADSSGGALANSGLATITNSTFSQNHARANGGAIWSTGALQFVNNSVHANFAGYGGGGVWVHEGTAAIANSILWANTDGSTHARTGAAGRLEAMQLGVFQTLPLTAATVTRSLVQGLFAFAGNNNSAFDPLWLAPESGNFALAAQSPAIDRGQLAALSATGYDAVDATGAARVAGTALDAGATEFNGTKQTALALTSSPSSRGTCAGRAAVFTVHGAEVEWQRSSQPDSGFVSVTGLPGHDVTFAADVSTLTLPAPNAGDHDHYYRFTVGGYTSAPYRLTVGAPSILRVNALSTATTPDGLTWPTAFPTVGAALAVADSCTDIWIARGIYDPAPSLALQRGVRIYGGFSGNENTLGERDFSTDPTILRGTTVFTTQFDTDRTAIVDRVTLRSTGPGALLNFITASAGPRFVDCRFEGAGNGAALRATFSSPRFENCTFTGFNTPSTNALWLTGSFAEFDSCVFEQNAGQLLIADDGSRVLLADVVLRQHASGGTLGSLITVRENAEVSLVRGSVRDNADTFALNTEPGGTLTVFGTLFTGNSSSQPGTVLRVNGGVARLDHVTLTGNSSSTPSFGAVIYASNGALEITNSILFGNTGASNASLESQQLRHETNAALTLTHSIVAGYASLGGTGNSGFDPFLGFDFTPAAYSPAVGAAGSLPEWAQAFASGSLTTLGAVAFTGTSQPPVQVARRATDVTVYARNPATFFIDVPAGTEADVVWEFSADGSNWSAAIPHSSRSVTLASGRSTLTVLNATAPGGSYRYRIPAQSFTSPALALNVLARRVLRVSAISAGGNGSSWDLAYRRLEDAIAAADSSAEIWIREGTYMFQRAVLPAGVEIYGGFAGGEASRNPTLPPSATVLRGSLVALNFPAGVVPETRLERFSFTGNLFEPAVALFAASLVVKDVEFAALTGTVALQARSSTVSVTNAVFSDAARGSISLEDSTAAFAQCVFNGNGANALADVQLRSTTATFADVNFTASPRGVPLVATSSNVTLTRGIFRENAAGSIVITGASGQFSGANLVLDRNGAGLRVDAGDVTLRHVTFAGNRGRADGQALFVGGGSVALHNSIAWGNRNLGDGAGSLEQQQIRRVSGALTLSHVAIEGLATLTGTALTPWDPLFADATTGDFRLPTFSPALNAGSATGAGALTSDLDGASRTFGSAPDLGAYETQSAATAGIRLRQNPASVLACAGSPASFTVVTDGRGADVVWHADSSAQINLANTSATTDASTLAYAAVPSTSGSRVWFTIAGTSYVSPSVTLAAGAARVIHVRAGAAAGGDGLSWATAFRRVADAVALNDGCAEIWIANGVYEFTAPITLTPGLRLRGGFSGTENSINARRAIAATTVLVAPANGELFDVTPGTGVDRTTLIEGLVLSGGANTRALALADSSPQIVDCVIEQHGAFAAVHVNTGSPLFRRVTFRHNSLYALYVVAGAPEVDACLFFNNTISTPTAAGSAIHLTGASASVLVQDSYFEGNEFTAVGVHSGGAATILRSRFLENSGDQGGALVVNGRADVRHSLFARNIGRVGGAIVIGPSALGLTLVNATVVANRATQSGGGLVNFGTLTTTNSIFWSNSDPAPLATIEQQQVRAETGATTAVTSSIIHGLAAYAGNNNSAYDPLFADEGSLTIDDYRLDVFSPAINAGTAASYGANDDRDFDGESRVVGTAPDLGASEVRDVRGFAPVYFTETLARGLTGRCTVSGGMLSVEGAPGTLAALRWERFSQGQWLPIFADSTFTPAVNGSTATLHVAGSSEFVNDVFIRAAVAGTTYFSAARRVSQQERPRLHVAVNATPGGDGLSWATAFRTLAEATAVAGECTEIWVAAGDYDFGATVTVPATVSILGGFAGNEAYAAQRDASVNLVTIFSTSGHDLLTFAVGAGRDTTLADLTLLGSDNAAIVREASPTFRNVRFAGQAAAAALIWHDAALPRFENCRFEGAGLSIAAPVASPVNFGAEVHGSAFIGAKIQSQKATLLSIANSTFSNGTIQIADNLDTRIGASTFSGVQLAAAGNGQLLITGSEFANHNLSAANLDGGALNLFGPSATIVNSVFRGNTARDGGAINIGANTVTLRNVVVRDNAASGNGGGINVDGGLLIVVNSTIANNRALGLGGGVATSGSTVTLRNSILWGNTAPLNSSETLEAIQVWFAPGAGPHAVTATHSVIEGLTRLAGNSNTGLDPQLESFGSVLALSPYSPVIDRGDDAFVVPNETDVRRAARVQFAHVDPGAAEASSIAPRAIVDNAPFLARAATVGRHVTASLVIDSSLVQRLGSLTWGWQLNSGSGWTDLVHGVDGRITDGGTFLDLVLFNVAAQSSGAQLRAVARQSGNIVYTSEASTLEVQAGRIARVLPGAPSGGDGSSWALAYNSLATALAAAADGDIVELWLAAGTHSGDSSLISGVSLYGGFTGTETSRAQRNASANVTVISGGTSVLVASGQLAPITNATVIDGVTLTGGTNGVLVFHAAPLFRHVVFTGNSGHGVSISGSGSAPRFEDCRIIDNTGTQGAGVSASSGSSFFERTIIAGNSASGSGGGIQAVLHTLQLRNSLVVGNRSGAFGGGLDLTGGSATLRNVTIAANAATALEGAGGAGIWQNGTTLDLRNSILWSNRTTAGGASIELQQYDRQSTSPSHNVRFTALEGLATYAGNNNTATDPFFAYDPGANAAPFSVGDFVPAACSLVVDAGDSSLVLADDTDLRAFARRFDAGTVDLGAYEAQSARSTAIAITSQPVSPIGCPGTDVTLTVGATGNGLTYEWEFDSLDGQGFLPVVDDALHDNVTSATLTVHLLSPDQHNWLYRARVRTLDGCRAVTNSVATQVSTSRLFVDASAASGGNGRSWATAYQTITAALADPLLTQCGASEIRVAAGTYTSTSGYQLIAGVSILGGYPAGGGARDVAANITTLATTSTACVTASANVTGAVLDGVTIEIGNSAAISLQNAGTPTFRNVRLNAIVSGRTLMTSINSTPLFDGLEVLGVSSQSLISQSGGTVTIDRLVARGISSNTFISSSSGTFNLVNALITGCTFSSRVLSGTANIRHSTIASNHSSHLFIFGTSVSVFNSIIWGNTATNAGNVFVNADSVTVRYSNVQGSLSATLEQRTSIDPQFVAPLLASAAPTTGGNYQLNPCSPFVSVGSNAYSSTLVDVLGSPRPFDAIVDLGAYELAIVVLTLDSQPAAATASWSDTATFAVSAPGATTYQWQRSRSGGGFTALTDGADYTGATSASLTLLRPTPAANGDLYRVVVSDGSCRTITSTSAAFTYLNAGSNSVVGTLSGDRIATAGDTLDVDFNGNLVPASITASALAIHGLQSAHHGTSAINVVDQTLTLSPAGNFSAGERVWVTLTDAIQQTPSASIRPLVRGFRGAVTPVVGAAYAGATVDWRTNAAVNALAAGDFNGDGWNDLIASTADGLALFLNNGAGDFSAPLAIGGSATAGQILAGDFGRDGALDFVAIGTDGQVTLWKRLSAGFNAANPFGSLVQAGAVGDLNGDGHLDLFLARNGADEIWFNDGTGVFTNSAQALGNADTRAVALGDFDGDGALDAIVATASGDPQLWRNDGRGGFTAGAAIPSGAANGVAVADANADGFTDVAFSHGDRASSVWTGNGAGAFARAGGLGNLSFSLDNASVSDFYADFANYKTRLTDNNTATYFHYDNTSVNMKFNVGSTVPVKEIAVYATNQADGYAGIGGYLYYTFNIFGLRANGDVVTLGFDPNLGTSSLRPNVPTPNGMATLSLADNNEVFPQLQVIVTSRGSGATVWLAEMRLRGEVGGLLGSAATGIEFADFDGDSDHDVWTRGTNGTARRFNNNGTGTFTTAPDATASSGAAFALADFSGSGALDLLHAPTSGTGLRLRLYRTYDITLAERTSHTFSAAQFTARLSGPEQTATAGIRFDPLPAFGSLLLNGTPLAGGDTVPAAQLGQLVYAPLPAFHGVDEFSWSAVDANAVVVATHVTRAHVVYDARLPRILAQSGGPNYTVSSPLTLSVSAAGDSTLTYQWYRDNQLLVGATADTFTLAANRPQDVGIYHVVVSNSFGNVTSAPIPLAISGAPVFTATFANTSARAGQTVTFAATAVGSAPLVYAWYRGTVGDRSQPVAGNVSSFTTAALSAITAFWVEATNSFGATTHGAVVTLDNAAPTFTGVPTNQTIATDAGLATAVVTWTAPSSLDNVGVISHSSTHASGATFPIGTTTVTYTAADFAGNIGTASFTVTVADHELPEITNVPANRSVSTSSGLATGTTTWSPPSATDNVGVATFTANHASGATFALGATTVTYTATDAAGNQRTASFTVTVVDGEQPILANMPANISVNTSAGLATAVVTWTAPSASDNASVTSLTATHASGASFPVGTTTVTYTASDAASNQSSASFTITVVDAESPTIAQMPADIIAFAAFGATSASVSWTAPTATDNVGVSAFTSTHSSGSTFPLGTTTVIYSATDAAGNLRTSSFRITIEELPTSLEKWRQEHFTTAELANPAISGPLAIYGADGLTNLLKYALGLNPKIDATRSVGEVTGGATTLEFTYTRPADRPDIAYAVEVSADLVTWTTTGVTHARIGTATGTETWRATFPLGQRVFLRLRVAKL